jgi:hypothetical protein
MLKLFDILGRGYFPRELPPPFNTSGFAKFIKSYGRSAPTCFASVSFVSKCAGHNLPRSGTLRRTLGIPNPVNFYRLARFIREHWKELCAHTAKSNISLTTPSEGSIERAIDRRHTLQELPKHRAMLRSHSRYVLKADISRFYDTIYTHSIPWALHGKFNAKADKTHG